MGASLPAAIKASATAPISASKSHIFSLELLPPSDGRQGRRGKVFIQPRAGWNAGFNAGQAFLIHFELEPLARIHPDQGQVELYLDWRPGQADTGVMELEVHAPCVTLAPGESTTAHEWWIVRRYDGPDRRANGDVLAGPRSAGPLIRARFAACTST